MATASEVKPAAETQQQSKAEAIRQQLRCHIGGEQYYIPAKQFETIMRYAPCDKESVQLYANFFPAKHYKKSAPPLLAFVFKGKVFGVIQTFQNGRIES